MEEEVNESRAAGLSGKNLDDPASLWKNSPQFKKNLEVILSQKQLSESIHCSSPGETRHKACVKNLVCAGRALRNAFLSNGKANWKAHVRLAKIIRRTYNGLELVEWLMDHCKFIDNRVMASKVWNTLLSIKMLQPVDQQKLFRDSRSLYQFTFEECESQTCNFRNPANWMDAVHLLLQLLPNVYQKGGYYQESLDEPDKTVQDPVIKKSVLNHLTVAVQHELLAALAHRQYTKSSFVENSLQHLRPGPPTSSCPASSWPPSDAAAHVCESHEEMTSARPPPSPVRRYTPLPAAPEKVVEHLLFHLRLDEEHRNPQSRETDLLDDFLLTYPVFMSTSDLCQALLGHYCSKKGRMKEEGRKTLLRKRKVLHLLSQWSSLSADPPQDDEPAKLFLTTLYRYVLDDLFEFPSLEKDLKDLQKLLRMHRRCTIDDYSPQRKNKVLYQQLSLKDNWRPIREAQTEGKEVLCHLYVTVDSYVSIRTHSKVSVQELLRIVEERLDCAEEDIVLVAVTYTGDKVVLQADQCVFSSSLRATQRLHVCRRDMTEINSLFTDNGQQCSGKMLNMNTWDVAVSLTNCDWSLFNKVHEQELVYFTLSRDGGTDHTVALEQMLQRCNETQQWVMSEVLLCSTLGKRVQIFKKFIKIAAHCKAQRNFISFFSIILGLNGPAVGRLTQTWEKIPGKFKKLFSELESLTDPSLNHKAYRDAFRKMKSPKIPFLPLLLKDITFIHEGNKTFLDNQVNFAKLHMIADVVRVIRQSRTEHMGNMLFQKDSVDVRTYINYLHVVDNQETLFELSHRLEPKT